MRYRLRWAGGLELGVQGDRLVEPLGDFPLTLEIEGAELRPGLINAHDHLHRNHYPRLGRPPYLDAYEWGRDIHVREASTIARARRVERREALLFGALKNLMAGVTTVVHHDPWEADFEMDFPIRVARVRTVHSLGTEPDRASAPGGDPGSPLCIHLAEGTTPQMAEEVREADRLGLLTEKLIAVHGVGVDSDGVERLAQCRAALVWCPTSNEFLLGRTASSALLDRVDVLVGSDSLLTAQGTLLDELRAARSASLVDDERLLAGVGALSAARIALPPPSLDPGARADIVILGRPVLEASCEDVQLVIVAGQPRLGDERYAGLFAHAAVPVERLRVGRSMKLVCAPLGSVAARIVADWPEVSRIF